VVEPITAVHFFRPDQQVSSFIHHLPQQYEAIHTRNPGLHGAHVERLCVYAHVVWWGITGTFRFGDRSFVPRSPRVVTDGGTNGMNRRVDHDHHIDKEPKIHPVVQIHTTTSILRVAELTSVT
jgi:hypothetical protein